MGIGFFGIKERSPCLEFSIEGRQLIGTLDTGSNYSIMPLTVLDRLGLDCVEVRSTQISIVSATNHEVKIVGEIFVPIKVGKFEELQDFPFQVTENLSMEDEDCILGMNFLEGFAANWNFSNGMVKIGNTFVDTKNGFVIQEILKKKGKKENDVEEDVDDDVNDDIEDEVAEAGEETEDRCEGHLEKYYDDEDDEDDDDDKTIILDFPREEEDFEDLPPEYRNLGREEIDGDMMHVKLKTKLNIWPRSEAVATCEVVPKAAEGSVYVIEPHVDVRFFVESGIVRITNGKFQIPITNLGNAPLVMNAGTKVAYAHDTDDDYVIKAADLPNVSRRSYLRKMKEKVKLKEAYEEVLTKPPHVSGRDYGKLMECLLENRDVISIKGENLGFTDCYEFKVQLVEGTRPIYVHPYRIPQSQKEIVEQHVQEMLEKDIIEPSNSPWSAPVLLVKKKDGSLRFCVDYRRLNAVTIPDRFPIPLMQDIVTSLGKAQYFSSLDLLSGYWQMTVAKDSRPMTAFSTHSGHYEFKRLPFGVRNGPACFSRLMNHVLTGLTGRDVYVYLDDIIIFSSTIDEHLAKLKRVFSRLRQFNLKLKLSKCDFLKTKIAYLGYQITANGVRPDPEKLRVLEKYPVPRSADDVRSFLGFVGFYRQFIPNFSTISRPLTGLLRKSIKFDWTEECQSSFEELKKNLMEEPILKYPDFEKKFVVVTDASNDGIGGVLMQEHDGKLFPIAYASRHLQKPERNYPITEKEALAVVWSMKKFRNIIYGYEIEVLTDHQALKYLFKDKILEGRMSRWSLKIQDFSPTITYIPGKANVLADCLSRMRREPEKVEKILRLKNWNEEDVQKQSSLEQSSNPLEYYNL